MKIINFVMAFVIILLPFHYLNNYKVNTQRLTNNLELRYNAAVDTAVRDAADSLKFNVDQNKELQYQSRKKVNVNVSAGIESFWNTLYLNFEAQNDSVMQGVLKNYVPAIVIIGYDGYHMYTMDRYKNKSNETEVKHLLQPKRPYAYVDQYQNSLSFTLDDFVTVYERTTDTWHYGKRSELAVQIPSVPLLQDETTFNSVRMTTIVNTIQEDLQYQINYYNEHAKRYGISYTFTLPTISQEDWNNTVDDVGVLAFVQGVPMGNTTYNHYALGGSRLIKSHPIKGAINKQTGLKYYFRSYCEGIYSPNDFEVQETFGDEKEAALAGYIPYSCNN